jgi:DNA-binding NtrC family response regulator
MWQHDGRFPMAKLQVLVLDDEPMVSKRLRSVLGKMGCEVETFDSPNEAFLRMYQKRFDIVVSDIVMDELDGIQLLEYTKQRCAETKVILITGYASMDMARSAKEKGAFAFIAKPFKPDELRAVVARAAAELGAHLDYQPATTEEEEVKP